MRNLWLKFKALKTWQKIVIVIGILLLGLIGSSPKSENASKTVKPLPTLSPTSSPEESISPSATSTPTDAPSPESPIEFRFAALRDLTDMRKDVNDARIGITNNGLGKFYWNVASITFNLVQLETRVPREEYAANWNKKLGILKIAVEDLGSGGDQLTISSAKSQLNRVLGAIPPLEAIARSLAN
jgi:hypothetical protein